MKRIIDWLLSREPELVPIEVIISRRVQNYRGVPDWEAYKRVKIARWEIKR